MENTESKVVVERPKKGVIVFDKPVMFEATEHKSLDLSKLENLTTENLIYAETLYHKSGGSAINPETTMLYSMIIAYVASDKPYEFFDKLPVREALKIKREIYSFFYGRA